MSMLTIQNFQVYSAATAPHWAVGFSSLIGATKSRLFCIATFFAHVFAHLWQAGRGSRKARWCSISLLTPLWLATPFSSGVVSFNLLMEQIMTQATPSNTPTTPQIDTSSPVCLYQVEESVTYKLDQLRGTLAVLIGLAGTASVNNSTATPEFTLNQLHDMFWMMQDTVEFVIENITQYPALFHRNERIM